jgi:DNA invertase Pin-like site-specific DNA recombinase
VGANDHSVVGWAEDIDVSGAIDPFETPQLGEWLSRRAPEWDVLCAWKLDRLGRNAIHLNKLFGWCGEHDKTVVSCSESIDLGNWAGRMLASVIAGLAEGELEAIRERQRSSRSKLRETARWAGGKPPFGYKAVKRDDGKGWSLEVDPLARKVIRRIVDDVLGGKPVTRIARELTCEGYRTPTAYYAAQKAGRPALRWAAHEKPSGKWATTPLRNMLRSKALRGYVQYNGETVRDDDGMPIQIAEPLVALDEWELLQAALDRIQRSRRGIRRLRASPLAGIAVCLECGLTLHHDRNTANAGDVYRYYRCQNQDTAMIPAERLESLVEESFLAEVGDIEVRDRVWAPGDSNGAELRKAVNGYDELVTAAGRTVSTTAKLCLQRQLASLDARIAELETSPGRAARWEYRPTGETYRSVWETSDTDARRELLRKSGITVAASISGVEGKRSASNPGQLKFELRIPTEIKAGDGPLSLPPTKPAPITG